jgi:hypothetical protein
MQFPWIFPAAWQPQWAQDMEQRLTNQLEAIMALVQVDQSQLDTLATALQGIVANLTAEIAALKTALPAGDFSAVEAQLAALQALEVPPAGP